MPDQAVCDDYPHRVLRNRPVTPVIRELLLAPEQAAMRYQAGQYVLLGDCDYRIAPRSYSVANAPRPDGQISLLVTRVEGGAASCWVHEELREGARVTLEGPYGTFTADPGRSGPVLLLAAGSGLAPARALAEAFLAERITRRAVTLFFSARTRADTIDHARLARWARTRRDFHYLLTLTRDPEGTRHARIPALLPTALSDLSGWEVYTSGPPGFVIACDEAARDLGAEPAMVHTEEFFSEPQPWTGRAPVRDEPSR